MAKKAKKASKKEPKVKIEVVKSRDPKNLPPKRKVFEPKGPVPKLTKEDCERLMEEGRQAVEAFRRKQNEPPKEERTGTCRVCGGLVVGVITRKYLGDPMHMIVGPGSANQMTNVHEGWHCEDCGIKYKFPPAEVPAVEDEDGELFVDHTDSDAMSRASFFDDIDDAEDEEDDDDE